MGFCDGFVDMSLVLKDTQETFISDCSTGQLKRRCDPSHRVIANLTSEAAMSVRSGVSGIDAGVITRLRAQRKDGAFLLAFPLIRAIHVRCAGEKEVFISQSSPKLVFA